MNEARIKRILVILNKMDLKSLDLLSKSLVALLDRRGIIREDDRWVTLDNGVHVKIDDDGVVVGSSEMEGIKLGGKQTEEREGKHRIKEDRPPELKMTKTPNPGSRGKVGTIDDYNRAREQGRVVKRLKIRQQDKHRPGTKAYEEKEKQHNVSIVTMSNEDIIRAVAKMSGSENNTYIVTPDGAIKEILDFGKEFGYYDGGDGVKYKTTRGTIHHSSTGYHVVCARPKGAMSEWEKV